MADKLTAYRVRKGKRVATYRIAVVYEQHAATVYSSSNGRPADGLEEDDHRSLGRRPGMRAVEAWEVEGS